MALLLMAKMVVPVLQGAGWSWMEKERKKGYSWERSWISVDFKVKK